jgi:hypothetical protein
MERHPINILLAVLILMVLSSCSQNGKTDQLNTFQNIHSSKIQYKDSLYIMYTVQSWSDSNFDLYHDYSKDGYGIKKEDFKYKILRAFYSPDSLKFFCWIVTREPNTADCKRPQGYSYSSSDIIGFRNSVKEPWKLYPLELEKAVCFDNENEIMNQLGQYYFQRMKDHSEDVNKKFLDKNYGGKVRYDLEEQTIKDGYGDKNDPVILKNYGYNLQDKDFWTKSLIWQKGARIPGLYNFQTTGNVTPDEKNVELYTPKITYPDSILKLYK